MRPLTRLFIFLPLLFSLSFSSAQEPPTNVQEMWVGFSLKGDASEKLSLSLEQQLRTFNGFNQTKSNFFEFGAKYDFTKVLSTKVMYRYSIRPSQRNVNRFAVDNRAKKKVKALKTTFSYRLRLQYEEVVYTRQTSFFLRNKFEAGYKLSKLVQPYLAYENFYETGIDSRFKVNRYTLGAEWRLNSSLELKSFVRLDQEISVKRPENQYIIGLITAYKF